MACGKGDIGGFRLEQRVERLMLLFWEKLVETVMNWKFTTTVLFAVGTDYINTVTIFLLKKIVKTRQYLVKQIISHILFQYFNVSWFSIIVVSWFSVVENNLCIMQWELLNCGPAYKRPTKISDHIWSENQHSSAKFDSSQRKRTYFSTRVMASLISYLKIHCKDISKLPPKKQQGRISAEKLWEESQ